MAFASPVFLPPRFASRHSRTPWCSTAPPASTPTTTPTPTAATFRELYPSRLPAWLHERLDALRYVTPTPIQASTLTHTLGATPGEVGRDAILHAETGSGKTLAYLLPALANMQTARSSVQVLVIVPTPELATQVTHLARRLTATTSIPVLAVSTADRRTTQQLRHTAPRIVVGDVVAIHTLHTARRLRLDLVRLVVVDEFDAILASPTTVAALGAVLSVPPRLQRQTLLASATVPRHNHFLSVVKARKWTRSDILYVAVQSSKVPMTLEHSYVRCGRGKKTLALCALLKAVRPQRTMVFVAPSRDPLHVASDVDGAIGIDAALVGPARRSAMQAFRSGQQTVMICTELGARGLDVDDVRFVIHLDTPTDADSYLHRAGRCARAGKEGTSVLLVEDGEMFFVERLANVLNVQFRRIRSPADLVDATVE